MADETQKIIIDVQVEADEAVKRQVSLKEASEQVKAEIQRLRGELKEGKGDYQKNSEEIVINEAKLKNLSNQLLNNSKIIQANAQGVGEVSGAYRKLSDEYLFAAAKAKDMAAAYGSNDERAKQAAQTANALNERLKAIDSSVGQNQRRVGDYAGELSKLPGGFGAVAQGAQNLNNGFKMLATNPFMAIVQLLAPIIIGLVNQFKAFKSIMDPIEVILSKVGAVFGSLINSVMDLLTGAKSLGQFFSGLAGDMDAAAIAAEALTKAQQELDDQMKINEVNQARYKNQIDELILQSKDRTATEEERIAAIEKALQIEAKAFEEQKAIADEKVRIAEEAIIVGNNLTAREIANLRRVGVEYAIQLQDRKRISDEQVEELKAALLNSEQIENQSIQLREKAINRQMALEEKRQEEAEKRAAKWAAEKEKRLQAEIKAAQTSIDLFRIRNSFVDENRLIDEQYYNGRVKLVTDTYAKEKAIIQKEYDNRRMTLDEANLKLAQAEKVKNDELLKLAQQRANILISVLEIENRMVMLKNQERLAGQEQTDAQIYESKIQAIEKATSEEIARLDIMAAEGVLSTTEYNRQLALIEQQGRTDRAIADAEFKAAQKEQQLADEALTLQNTLDRERWQTQQTYDLRMQALENERALAIAEAEKTGADVYAVKEKFANLEKALENEKVDAIIGIGSLLVDSVSAWAGEGTVISKLAASAQIAISTYQAAMGAFAQATPTLGIIGGVAAAAIATSTGIAQIAKVWAVDSGLEGDKKSGGSGQVQQVSSSTAGIATRRSGVASQQSTQTALNNAMAVQNSQPVLVTTNLTDALAAQVMVKDMNSL